MMYVLPEEKVCGGPATRPERRAEKETEEAPKPPDPQALRP